MSIVPNYFNNFQVRPPLLKNPINRAPPQQLTRSRPGIVTYNGTGTHINVSQVVGQTVQISTTQTNTVGVFTLPTAGQLLRELGVQNSGLSTPTWSIAASSGDCIFLNIVNKSNNTGAISANAFDSTGAAWIDPAPQTTAYNQGKSKIVTIQFTNVSSGADGVTGSYVVF